MKKKNTIPELIKKAHRSLRAAKTLLEQKDYDFALVRAYYALFYISEALLLSRGLEFSKHSSVISSIYHEFIQSNELPKEYHQTLHSSFGLRTIGDYWSTNEFDEPLTNQTIKTIETQIKVGITLLEKIQK